MTEPIGVEAILGAWELVSYELRSGTGELLGHPLGADAAGIIQYTADGYMSAQLMRRGQPPFDQPATARYLAYAGPFELDEPTATFRHHVEVSLLPNWLGEVQVRHGRLTEQGRLVLSADTTHDGEPARAQLTWRRPEPPAG